MELREAQREVLTAGGDARGRRLQDLLWPLDMTNGTNTSLLFNTSYSNITIPNQTAPNLTPDRRQIVPTLFKVVGTCRGCPVLPSGGFNLFDDVFNRRRRSLERDLTRGEPMAKQLVVPGLGVCTCPAGESPSTQGGPSAASFEFLLVKDVAKLPEDGGTTSPDNIVEVSWWLFSALCCARKSFRTDCVSTCKP